MKKRHWLLVFAIVLALVSYPPQWYPLPVRLKLTEWFGAESFRALPESVAPADLQPETFCPPDPSGWREAHRRVHRHCHGRPSDERRHLQRCVSV